MAEKRFHSPDYDVKYYTEIYDEKKRLLISEVVDLLNELNEENQQLTETIRKIMVEKFTITKEDLNEDYNPLNEFLKNEVQIKEITIELKDGEISSDVTYEPKK